MTCEAKSTNSEDRSFLCFGGEDWWYHNRAHTDMQLMRRFFAKRYGTLCQLHHDAKTQDSRMPVRRKACSQGQKHFERAQRIRRRVLGLQSVHFAGTSHFLGQAVERGRAEMADSADDAEAAHAGPGDCGLSARPPVRRRSKSEVQSLIYQRTDRFEDDPNVDRDAILDCDRRLKANADITVYVNKSLYDEEAGQCKKALLLDHGVDYEMFATAECDPKVPADIADIGKPVVGYFGALDGHKLDTDFLEAVADRLPDMSFVFIGKPSLDCFRVVGQEKCLDARAKSLRGDSSLWQVL